MFCKYFTMAGINSSPFDLHNQYLIINRPQNNDDIVVRTCKEKAAKKDHKVKGTDCESVNWNKNELSSDTS